MNIFRELDHLNTVDGYLGGFSQHVEKAHPEITGKAFIDHFKSR